MGRSTEDLVLPFKLLISSKAQLLDATIPPTPFNEDIYNSKKKLKIGFYKDDKFFEASRSCVRAVEIAVEKLKELGHEVVEFEPENVEEMFSTFVGLLTADGAKTLLKGIEGAEIEPALLSMKCMFFCLMCV